MQNQTSKSESLPPEQLLEPKDPWNELAELAAMTGYQVEPPPGKSNNSKATAALLDDEDLEELETNSRTTIPLWSNPLAKTALVSALMATGLGSVGLFIWSLNGNWSKNLTAAKPVESGSDVSPKTDPAQAEISRLKTVTALGSQAQLIKQAPKTPARFLPAPDKSKSVKPLEIEGKTLVVVGMDKSIKTALAPFLTGIMQMVLDRNVAIARKDPFVFILDEAPTVGIDLATAFATQRSAGAVTVMGYQDFGQLEQRYGESLARTILSNCATKAWFNPQELKTAQWCSDYIGEEQLNLKQKSRGHSGGKASTNVSDNERTRKLYSPDQFLRLPSGKCILINPAIAGQDEVGIPIAQKIKIPQSVEQQQDWSKRIWNTKIRDRMSQQSPQPKLTREELRVHTERMIDEREKEAERILPLIEAPKKSDKTQIEKIQAAF